ncbi:transcriptional regulator, GntR family [Catenulispora acidiphila DSM 44928]|uniref:Transcriptional regulator, GntR family n=1 Tax=Catenulispora acidiphila (strain DSM 44928 / JCM 14897 / NBRC 102108 / NRRL B-24433 / ID139908) TaxID=479433 RepID=C7PZ79_CATAD|nr:GntR family transcriptional regulator [Catenulispora acidiphila]ACU71536.1 transcriptional regulator, GntR family [Catenulispora acidiphila DSM 44928]
MSLDVDPAHAPQRTRGADPLWSQTADLLVEHIARRGLSAGAKLPPERDLCAQLDISRVTLRKALLHLVDRGVLTATQGRGWFVASRVAAREWPDDLESFTATARRKHMTPGAIVLVQEVRPATLDEGDRLDVPAGTPLVHLERIRLLNGVRIALDRTLLPLDAAPAVPDLDFTTASLFEVLRDAGVSLERSVATVEARVADQAGAEVLQVEPGAPILVLDQIIYSADQRPILASTIEYSGERYRLRTTFSAH